MSWDVLSSILPLGEATGRGEGAEELVRRLGERMDRTALLVADAPTRPRVYWEWWPKPLITPGRLSWMTDLIEMGGCSRDERLEIIDGRLSIKPSVGYTMLHTIAIRENCCED